VSPSLRLSHCVSLTVSPSLCLSHYVSLIGVSHTVSLTVSLTVSPSPPVVPHPAEKIGGFNSAMGSLWIVLSEMLHHGYNVIAQDADVVWLRDPRPAFAHSHGACPG
jgi:hypothetical protein